VYTAVIYLYSPKYIGTKKSIKSDFIMAFLDSNSIEYAV